MEEVVHVPAWQLTVFRDLAYTVFVALSKELHAHYSKYEDNDGQYQGQVSQSSHRVTNYLNKHVECGPRLCQFEDTKLSSSQERDKDKPLKVTEKRSGRQYFLI